MRIIIVDNSIETSQMLADFLQAEHSVLLLGTGQECLQQMVQFSPDILLVNDQLPDMSSREFCKLAKDSPIGDFLTIILMCSNARIETRIGCYKMGAGDYLLKPIHYEELKAKLAAITRHRQQIEKLWLAHFHANQQHDKMKDLVRQKSEELEATRNMTVFVIAKLAESRATGTGQHLERIRDYSRVLANELYRQGIFPEIERKFLDDLYNASPLHDIGKIAIPDNILLKEGPLTTDEFEIMKKHSEIGAETLQSAMQHSGYSSFLDMAVNIARHHHERFDGGGYPDGLAGFDIPLAAQIVSVVDVFDALTSHRIYKKAIPPDVAKLMIEQDAGRRFNPAIVHAFTSHFDDFMDIYLVNRDAPAEPERTYETKVEWW